MIYFKINKVPYQIPTKWEEVTVETFQRIASLDNKDWNKLGILITLSKEQLKLILEYSK